MSLAITYCRAQLGVDAPLVTVESHLSNGLPGFAIVGLPETAVREAKDRVRSALLTSGFDFPARRITVNLAPADLPKEGSRYDLAIAVGILAASGQLPQDGLGGYEFIGELGLGGEIRGVKGVLPAALAARDDGRVVLLAPVSAAEAARVDSGTFLAPGHLLEAAGHLSGAAPLPPVPRGHAAPGEACPDLRDVRGQAQAKRALEVAAAGGHSLLMIGAPGSGKTMLASRITGILPELSERQALEAAAVRSVAARARPNDNWRTPPFRSPHHSCSGAALIGGGRLPAPGEVSLAHHGVLFLDELPEFSRAALEQLREPLEAGVVHVSRAARKVRFPARFQLVCAMNPCPCGWLGDPSGRCRCTSEQVQRYRNRVSGPLLDRIDMHIEVPAVPREALRTPDPTAETSAGVRTRVVAARERQLGRQGGLNSALEGGALERHCALGDAGHALLDAAMARLRLSARSYHRILRLARTIADLAGSGPTEAPHVAQAVQLRCLDRRQAT